MAKKNDDPVPMYFSRRDDIERMPKLMDLATTAKATGLTEKRLEELATGGVAPCYRLDGGHPQFIRNEIVRWVRENLLFRQEGGSIPFSLSVIVDEPAEFLTIPDSLKRMTKHLKQMPSLCLASGVYFLINENKVVYVGKTTSLAGRIAHHKQWKCFDRVLYLPLPETILDEVERAFILKLKPPMNSAMTFTGVSELDVVIKKHFGDSDGNENGVPDTEGLPGTSGQMVCAHDQASN